MRFAPILAEHHAGLGIDPSLTTATLADVGLQLSIHRRAHACFGLETWGWLTHHLDGSLFRIGRLQFHLQPTLRSRGPLAAGDWFLGIHIPEDGPLHPLAVDEALDTATTFFAVHFPDRRLRAASCDSWLLDPHLANVLPTSNMAAFAARFELDALRPEPGDALYFTFRTRDMARVPALPRTTSLQRAVLERIDAGGVWQVGTGWIPWPATPSF